MLRKTLLLVAFLAGVPAIAQDVLTMGSSSGSAGSVVSVPVYLRDAGGTALGSDAGGGNRIQGFAFKVLFPTDVVASIGFSRAGVTASLLPMFETVLQGSGFASVVVAFDESNAPPLSLNMAAPGNTVGMLNVTLQAAATPGATAALRIDPPSAMLSNQTASVRESVSSENLALVNGNVTVASLATPAGLTATATSVSQIAVTWSAVSGATQYEVWRSSNGAAFAQLPNNPTSTSSTDSSVAAGTTYFYRVRAANGSGGVSGFSNIDAATTIFFTDDPVVAQSTIVKLVHVTELRTAVNAFRSAAGLSALAADGTIAAGALVRAQHLTALRTGLDQARAALVMSMLTWTDASPSLIKAVHVNELRTAVK